MMTMKSALITGAASGIGKACAERMAQEGYGVVVADVNLPAAEELAAKLAAEGLSAIAVHMDVADEQEVEAGFEQDDGDLRLLRSGHVQCRCADRPPL